MVVHRSGCPADGDFAECNCGASSRKYLNDVVFHTLVNQLANVMEKFRLDLDDLYQAALIADELYEKRKIR